MLSARGPEPDSAWSYRSRPSLSRGPFPAGSCARHAGIGSRHEDRREPNARASPSPQRKRLSVIITAHNEGPEVLQDGGIRPRQHAVGSRDHRRRRWLDRRFVLGARSAGRSGHPPSRAGGCGLLARRGKPGRRGRGVRLSRRPPTRRAGLPRPLRRAGRHSTEQSLVRRAARSTGVIRSVMGRPSGLTPSAGFSRRDHRIARPRQEITRISALRSPAYVIPRSRVRPRRLDRRSARLGRDRLLGRRQSVLHRRRHPPRQHRCDRTPVPQANPL